MYKKKNGHTVVAKVQFQVSESDNNLQFVSFVYWIIFVWGYLYRPDELSPFQQIFKVFSYIFLCYPIAQIKGRGLGAPANISYQSYPPITVFNSIDCHLLLKNHIFVVYLLLFCTSMRSVVFLFDLLKPLVSLLVIGHMMTHNC